MAVSLKKTHEELHKIDLSKSSIPGDLPKCTPVHLLDEDETIQSCSTRLNEELHKVEPSKPSIPDNLPECTPVHQLGYEKHILHEKVVFLAVVSILLTLVLIILSALSLEFEINFEFKEFFDIANGVIEYMLGNPLCCAIIAMGFVFLSIRIACYFFKNGGR